MVQAHLDIKNALDAIAPTYYEQFVNSNTAIPCITYVEAGNTARVDGTSPNLHYSDVEFYIKVWADDLAEAIPLQDEVDVTMKSLGFRRTSYRELGVASRICLIGLYKGLGLERDR